MLGLVLGCALDVVVILARLTLDHFLGAHGPLIAVLANFNLAGCFDDKGLGEGALLLGEIVDELVNMIQVLFGG